ncbi:gamma-glutamyltransferase [Haliangium ochraceum]|uniref:Glutathione hydrolase proenzyme n=1 Tax=Haliangium ochraceum (strain DSM 14365 / JCM 11303 / SMP-2) TaxID=502025 RepID=D0LU25_HALO1|nr:gamma-glutamyltransferase [Haliangium ochraceum]ACY17389.1 gamma-glutamyltransferase [Haliangium ochraceum DSM 14365]
MIPRNRLTRSLLCLAAATLLALPAASCKRSQTSDPAPAAQPLEAQTGPDDSGHKLPVKDGEDTAVGTRGGVSSAEANASEIGLAILQRGGNAVDAAIAVGFALGVTHPSAGNIGGGGFMIIRLPDGKTTAIDYREMAPGKASRDMYLDAAGEVTNDSRMGPRAAGIPGVVRGFAKAHAMYGSLPWEDLIMPAVKLAREGWALDSHHADDLGWGTERMDKYAAALAESGGPTPELQAALEYTLATFRKADGSAYQTGEVWKQPDLADTLEAIATQGADAFYTGPLAEKMASEVQAMGGIWTAADLANYKAVVREPVVFGYRGHEITTMPPPSAGGVVLRQILAASEVLGLYELDWDSDLRLHLYLEALRRIYADRNLLLGDPDFVDIPMKTLLDVSYLEQRMADVQKDKATPSSEVGAGVELEESAQTTHFSVVDENRMAVANTYTLNGGFGAKLQIPGTGVTLNNEMDDFTAKVGAPNMFGLVQGPQNSIAPGKRMLSSMTPTIVTKDGKLRAVVGSPGGPTITTTVAQIIMQIIDHERSIAEAVRAPRTHHQWLPDSVLAEDDLSDENRAALEARGHSLRSWGSIGHANVIEIDPESGGIRAVADLARDGGKAVAY